MISQFNIGYLFSKIWGYEPPENFKIEKPDFATEQTQFKIDGNTMPTVSKTGSPYYGTDNLGREFFLPVWIDNYLIPFAVVSIDCTKTIVNTPLPERGGTVKELVSIDDYKISIKGICVSDDNTYPESDIITLFQKFQKNNVLEIKSVLTDIFLKGITSVYDNRIIKNPVIIRDLKFPAVAGIENVKPFELQCESDMIFDLIVTN